MIFLIVFIMCICVVLHKMFYPWQYLDGSCFNILGKNKYGKTKQECYAELEKVIKAIMAFKKEVK